MILFGIFQPSERQFVVAFVKLFELLCAGRCRRYKGLCLARLEIPDTVARHPVIALKRLHVQNAVAAYQIVKFKIGAWLNAKRICRFADLVGVVLPGVAVRPEVLEDVLLLVFLLDVLTDNEIKLDALVAVLRRAVAARFQIALIIASLHQAAVVFNSFESHLSCPSFQCSFPNV